jgi:hypothetical protein
MKKMLLCASLALAAACGGAADQFAAATPDVRGQLIEITGSASEGRMFLAENNGVSSQDLTSGPEYLAKTQATVKALNDLVAQFLTPVQDLIGTTETDLQGHVETKVFGPKDEGTITWKLTVKHVEGHRFGWLLDGKPVGSPDTAYTTVAAGRLQRTGNAEHRGSGVSSIDLDAYAKIDSTSHAAGKLFNAFKHFGDDGDAKVVVYALKGFTLDPAVAPGADGIIYGHKTPSGEAVVRVAAISETLDPIAPSTTDAGPELMLARLHWIPGTGGRADVFFPSTAGQGTTSNGDVPAGKFIVAKSCWDKAEVEGYKSVAICDASTRSCPVADTTVVGDKSACQSGVDQDDDVSGADEQHDISEDHGAPGALDDAPESSMTQTETETEIEHR